jgi:gas vesicle protein
MPRRSRANLPGQHRQRDRNEKNGPHSKLIDPRDIGLDPKTFEPLASVIASRAGAAPVPPDIRLPAPPRYQAAITNFIDPRSIGLDPSTYEPLRSQLLQRPAAAQRGQPATPHNIRPPVLPRRPATPGSPPSGSTASHAELSTRNIPSGGEDRRKAPGAASGIKAAPERGSAQRKPPSFIDKLKLKLATHKIVLKEKKEDLAKMHQGRTPNQRMYEGKTSDEILKEILTTISDREKSIGDLKNQIRDKRGIPVGDS